MTKHDIEDLCETVTQLALLAVVVTACTALCWNGWEGVAFTTPDELP